MLHLFCNALVHVIYSVVSGQYSYTIHAPAFTRHLTRFLKSMHYL